MQQQQQAQHVRRQPSSHPSCTCHTASSQPQVCTAGKRLQGANRSVTTFQAPVLILAGAFVIHPSKAQQTPPHFPGSPAGLFGKSRSPL